MEGTKHAGAISPEIHHDEFHRLCRRRAVARASRENGRDNSTFCAPIIDRIRRIDICDIDVVTGNST
jgi:hypothetical protein